jgi:hypothetical protein
LIGTSAPAQGFKLVAGVDFNKTFWSMQMPGDMLVNATAGGIIIGAGTLLMEWAFARYAGIERDTLSAVVCSLIAYISVGLVDGFMSGRDFVSAYFQYLSGLGIVLLTMLTIDTLRSWWRRVRKVKHVLQPRLND